MFKKPLSEDIEVKDYGLFTDGITVVQKTSQEIEEEKTNLNNYKGILSNGSVFEGPISDSCLEALDNADKKLGKIMNNLDLIKTYLSNTSTTYNEADKKSSEIIKFNIDNGKIETYQSSAIYDNRTPESSVTIPNNISQSGYTVTCYGKDGWHLGGSAEATKIAKGTRQESVHEKWVENGARYKDGIAVIDVDGVDHYLVATSQTFGTVGDKINVTLENGENIPCVIADAKSSNDSTYTKYGHQYSNGVNVLEWEVDRNEYKSKGNPTTDKWGLEWDSSSKVTTVDNYGTMI